MKFAKEAQKAAADILTRLLFAQDMDDVVGVWDCIYEEYNLCDDPFTGCPCTPDEYCKNKLEYDRQTMMERYGHCDGLD